MPSAHGPQGSDIPLRTPVATKAQASLPPPSVGSKIFKPETLEKLTQMNLCAKQNRDPDVESKLKLEWEGLRLMYIYY